VGVVEGLNFIDKAEGLVEPLPLLRIIPVPSEPLCDPSRECTEAVNDLIYGITCSHLEALFSLNVALVILRIPVAAHELIQ